jgi:hypothetical protein
MKLCEIKQELTYKLNTNTSVKFQGLELPKPDAVGKWKFYDEGSNFEQLIGGKFKEAVKNATDSYKRLKATGFSHNLKVKQQA